MTTPIPRMSGGVREISDELVDAYKAEHAELHAEWAHHVNPRRRERCERCADGRWCRVAGDLCDRANTAGLAVQRAEGRWQW